MNQAEVQPRAARVVVVGSDPHPGGGAGVSMGGGFPPPGELTCQTSADPSSTGCYVPGTADYGYIANVKRAKNGARNVELLKNGIGSSYPPTLDCDG